MRCCVECQVEKPLSEFYRKGRGKAGQGRWFSRCKACTLADRARQYAARPEMRQRIISQARQWAVDHEDYQLRAKYGITAEDYAAMHDRQSGRCAICDCKPDHKLRVDHCHLTGEVRGLLCNQCNLALGQFRDSPELLQAAMEYLLRTALVVR